MAQKPGLPKREPLIAAIISYLKPGEERADAQCPGLRVRCLASGPKVFFYRYRSRDGALREMKLGEVGPLTLAKLGCPRVVQDRILNHIDHSVSAIYDQHRYDAEARAWLQKWADYLEELTVSNVIPLRVA